MKKKVVVFGSLPIASRIVEFLLEKEVEVLAVIGSQNPHNNDPWREVPLLFDCCQSRGVEIADLADLAVLVASEARVANALPQNEAPTCACA